VGETAGVVVKGTLNPKASLFRRMKGSGRGFHYLKNLVQGGGKLGGGRGRQYDGKRQDPNGRFFATSWIVQKKGGTQEPGSGD